MRELTGFLHLAGALVVLGAFLILWMDEHWPVRARRGRGEHRPDTRRRDAGLTLIELLVVVGILALLSTLYVVRMAATRATVQGNSDAATAQAVGAALSSYYMANACLPPTASPGVMPAGMTSYVHTWPTNLNYNYDSTNGRGVLQLLVDGTWVTQLTVSGPKCP